MEHDSGANTLLTSGDARFKPVRLLPYLLVSLLALVPCFWLPRIEAGDLGSHTYNAWLVSLTQQGRAPGLSVAHQTNNILFDLLLSRLAALAGFIRGERIAVCLSVLVFLWGSFAMITTVGGKPAWFVLPLLLMFSYGWTFHAGFFNFYLSLGLSFVALALLWRARGLGYLCLLPLLPLVWMAHPLGFFFFAAVAIYLSLARLGGQRMQFALAAAVFVGILALHFFLPGHYPVRPWQGPYYALLGLDQVLLGERYQLLAWALALAILLAVGLHFYKTRGKTRGVAAFFPVFWQLYLLGFLALALLPDAISLPRYRSPVDLLASRFTLAMAVLGCCVLSSLRPRLLFAVLSSSIALVYFAFVYQDAAKTYAMEKQAEFLVARAPQDARIISTIYPFRGFRIFVHHVMDRACIGRCFNIDNYEPSTGQFRLRADPASRLAANWEDANQMMIGTYVVKPEDLPLWQVFQCGPADIDLCLRPLHPGSLRSFP